MTEENRYQLLKLLEQTPSLNQRELAKAMGISLGKTNYCLNALIEKGLIKVANFKRSKTKMNYAYYLTPKGLDEKARVTMQFLKRKQQEYEALVKELEELQKEAALIECSPKGEIP
ncbi:MAG: MarR family EPS-associated transcriptional regulator [Gammaproteobacteria bacterium]|nr:MarR family EPS-associated transcriptional regulator [Gammaproteobacteria bacterium]